jgi:WD40 repeat protein
MTMRYFPLAIAVGMLSGWAASPADEPSANDRPKQAAKVTVEEIERLITQLGDDDDAKRQLAKKQLESIGEQAIPRLKVATESADDPEVRKAAKTMLEKLDAKARGTLAIFNAGKTRINGVAFSADGKRAVCSGWDGTLSYWNLEDHALIRQVGAGGRIAIMSVVFSPDGKRILSGGGDRLMRLWDPETGQEIRNFGHPDTVWDVVFSPDGTTALSGCGDGCVRLWKLGAVEVLQTLVTHPKGRAWTCVFTPDGKQAVTGGGNTFEKTGGPAASLKLWDLATGKEVRQFSGHTKDVRRVAISPDGSQLLSASFDGTVRLWNLATGMELKKFDGPGNFVESVSFTPDGKRAVCSYGPGSAEAVYDEDPRCSLKLWDLATGKEIKQFKGHGGPVLCLAISHDGQRLISGSADGTMRLWEIPK